MKSDSEFKWIDYGNNSTFTGDPIAGDADNNFFRSLQNYIEKQSDIKAKISIPDLLGLNIYENAIYLRGAVSHLHGSVFLSSKKAYKISTKLDRFAKSLNKRTLKLDEEFSKDDDNHPIAKLY
ncbi:unnamed protein product [Rhizophagus irregularis]|uniref:Uncharacterized protein n=1 Tax=Rhizophagus irregularis TaxID=588596 RepID=A0A916EEZ6_9GLOM|nr:unnamed protein product [Rhizophagus irregularis]